MGLLLEVVQENEKMWERFKNNELGRVDHDRLFFVFFLPYVLLSTAGGVLIQFELGDTSDAMVKWAIGVFFLPWLILIVIIQFRSINLNNGKSNRVLLGLIAIVLSIFASGAGFGYVNLFNAITGDSIPTRLKGSIVELKRYSGGWGGSRMVVVFQGPDRLVELAVSPKEFDRLKVGDDFSVDMFLGGLGYYYRWNRGFWK